jgi:hypothetical protein
MPKMGIFLCPDANHAFRVAPAGKESTDEVRHFRSGRWKTPESPSSASFSRISSEHFLFTSNSALSGYSPTNNSCDFYTFDARINKENKWKQIKAGALKKLM